MSTLELPPTPARDKEHFVSTEPFDPGSAAQLGINLVGMVLAGVGVIGLQKLFWKRVLVFSERLTLGRRPRHDTMPA